MGWWWERSNPEVATGAGVGAAAGILSLFGGGAGVLKVVTIVCSATAVTVGLCAGVAEILRDPPAVRAEKPKRLAPAPTASATPAPTPVATPAPKRERPKPARKPKQKSSTDLSGRSEIPATAREGTDEFSPSASGPTEAAPAPPTGGGEFAP